MSIIKESIEGVEPTTKYKLIVDNGDLQALSEVIEKFNFIDEQAALRFALYVLLKAEKNVVYVDQGDKTVVLTPTEQVIKKNGQETL